jgi:hypothetical protein
MKSAALQMARAIRGTGALGAAAGVLLFLVALFSRASFGRIFGIVARAAAPWPAIPVMPWVWMASRSTES